MKLIRTIRALTPLILAPALFATPTYAESPGLQMPETEQQWTAAMARPEYKGPDPCAFESKGVCTADDYHPQAAALVQFRTDSSVIDPGFNEPLNELGRALQNGLKDAVLAINGHADSTGSESHNLALSQRRANAVRDYLVQRFGIEPKRLSPVGYGESQHIASNDNPEGRRLNRRVAFERIGVWLD